MNKKNLLRMADYIETIPQKNFDMKYYRDSICIDDHLTAECNTVGCIIGHCTILDTPENIDKFRQLNNSIKFGEWSKFFTGLYWKTPKWKWCFGGDWKWIDNTPTGAAKRIRYLVENGLPDDWENQMYGSKPLSY